MSKHPKKASPSSDEIAELVRQAYDDRPPLLDFVPKKQVNVFPASEEWLNDDLGGVDMVRNHLIREKINLSTGDSIQIHGRTFTAKKPMP